MKNRILVALVLLGSVTMAQERKTNASPKKTKLFSLSPIHSDITKVNGLVMGAGHYENKRIEHQKVNGVNIDVLHPAPLALLTFGLEIPIRLLPIGLTYTNNTGIHVLDKSNENVKLSMNGLNASVGGFYEGTNFNGLNVSLIAIVKRLNGVSTAPVVNSSELFNGIQIAAIANLTEKGNGMQVAISNVAGKFKGVQVGLFNKSGDQRGLQFGLWNRNARRSLPFINWQFSKKKTKSKSKSKES
ncbi:hypothetical protein [Aquimarina sp. RZ0]|uniref:LA_2272 family surface repeat-containing protein n=1 Tax=Aquimarina sp. RZ0 TaxID=2607730 RepID=UPI0011F284D1|nr:hypothetical protein [Aquimarina sp. RZ0]KAA1243121.1 hypothetical protein F0000_22435 [Aquimarina sp. RZ0]